MKNKGLGRGLDAIFGLDGANIDVKSTPMSSMREIEITKIIPNPTQPRSKFDDEAMEELVDSIRTLGVIQPITVKRNTDNEYVIISGERRWRASKAAGLESIPAYIREVDDANLHAMALVENIQRQDLNAIALMTRTEVSTPCSARKRRRILGYEVAMLLPWKYWGEVYSSALGIANEMRQPPKPSWRTISTAASVSATSL